jgi:pyruvate dehydrogenase E2 component (dihydrolipoamide acetyltransferase)/2-oxoisovalerate dehydrogenase E2 component (dihydrolipoyl transacylase)
MDFRLPELGEGIYEAELVSWLAQPGQSVKRGDILIEVLTDKATMEVPSPFIGQITGLKAEPGQKLKIGDVVLTYEPAQRGSRAAADGAKQEPARAAVAGNGAETEQKKRPAVRTLVAAGSVRAAPSVRYMARQLGIDLASIQGSGPAGRILIEDLSRRVPASRPEEKPREEPMQLGKAGTRMKLHGIRRKIAEHMVAAKRAIPHYSYVDECEVTHLVRMRESLKEPYAQAGKKLTYLPFFVKAVVAALKAVPIVNATLDEEKEEIVLHDRYHIGVAVSTPNGLIVPVLHDADQKDLGQVAGDIDRLSADARAGKIRLEDLRGGTFTVTSIGGIGGLFSTPVINYPEAAILGIGKIAKRPIYDASGTLRPADMVYLSLSFDHRIIDGAIGAAFCNALIQHLENPARLLATLP